MPAADSQRGHPERADGAGRTVRGVVARSCRRGPRRGGQDHHVRALALPAPCRGRGQNSMRKRLTALSRWLPLCPMGRSPRTRPTGDGIQRSGLQYLQMAAASTRPAACIATAFASARKCWPISSTFPAIGAVPCCQHSAICLTAPGTRSLRLSPSAMRSQSYGGAGGWSPTWSLGTASVSSPPRAWPARWTSPMRCGWWPSAGG